MFKSALSICLMTALMTVLMTRDPDPNLLATLFEHATVRAGLQAGDVKCNALETRS